MADIKMALGLDTKSFDRGLANAGRSLGAFAAKMAAAVGVAVGFNSAIQAGRAVEDLSVRLQYLAGDAERGAAALDMARKAAQELPFSLEEISAGLSSIVPISGTFGELEQNIQAVAEHVLVALAPLTCSVSVVCWPWLALRRVPHTVWKKPDRNCWSLPPLTKVPHKT
jgi:hypothetical protein